MTATVDAEACGSLEEAIQFVASCGGGIVYTGLADTLFVRNLKLPPNVKLMMARPKEGEPTCDGSSSQKR